MQALCYFAGANSIFYGDQLLTTDNPETDKDRDLFERLGLNMEEKIETEIKAAKTCHAPVEDTAENPGLAAS